jgi:hypothetical protein
MDADATEGCCAADVYLQGLLASVFRHFASN